jgi:hypothetical protein
MIADIFIRIFLDLAGFIIGLLPSPQSLPNYLGPVDNAFASIAPYFSKANAFLPVDTMFIIFSIILGIEASILAVQFANWTFDKFRGAG